MNEELRHRSLELNDTNALFETVLSRIGLAVVVVDSQQNIKIWNRRARDLWGLTSEETEGQHLLSLDIGLPVGQIRPHLKAVSGGESEREEVTVEAVNRRGREFQCQVTIVRLGQLREDGVGAAIMMVESDSA